jgi:AcrR family transcriptional regulator
VYDHFPNLARLLHAVVEREERYAMGELDAVVPDDPGARDPVELLATGVRRFLDAVLGRPATWRIILLPLEGTPELVRQHVQTNRQRMLARVERLVRWGIDKHGLPHDLDVELTARAIRDLGEEAGRMVLTDPQRYSPERYACFVETVMELLWPAGDRAG